MDSNINQGSEERSEERYCDNAHAREEVYNLCGAIAQERDDLREYVTRLEEQVLPRFDVNGTNVANIFVSQKNSYLERVKIYEKQAVEAEKAHCYESQRLQRERVELQYQYDDLYQKTFGQNGYKERLASTHVALELANQNKPADIVECVNQLAEVTKERDEFDREARRLGVRTEELHLNWNAALSKAEELEKELTERENVQDNSFALREAHREIERLRRGNGSQDSYRVEASKRQVIRLQGEKIEWEQERVELESRNAELSLRLRTLEDMLTSAEAQQSSSDIPMADIGSDNVTPSLQPEVFGDAVWRRWSNRLIGHIRSQPKEVEDIYRLAAANLYRPGGAFPDPDPRPESPRQQFPGVTWVKELVDLGAGLPVAIPAEEGTWRQWANQLQDFVLTVPNEVSELCKLATDGQLMVGAEWIRQLITIASDRLTSAQTPATMKEYQRRVEVKELQAKIQELQEGRADRQQIEILSLGNQSLEQALGMANEKIEELQEELDGIVARFEDEMEQLTRKLKESYDERNLFKSLYESGNAHKEKQDEIKQLQHELRTSYDQKNTFKALYEKAKALSDEHEEVWQQKFDKEVAGADKHAAGLVEEAETLQGRLNGAHGVIADLEKEVERLRKQIAVNHTDDSVMGDIASGVAPEGDRQTTPESHQSKNEESDEEEEEEESEELRLAKIDLYNTLEEVEELKLKLGFADRAFNDMKEEFEAKFAKIENNSKEDMSERERMAEKLKIAEEKLKMGVSAEIRKMEREGQLEVVQAGITADQPVEADLVVTGKSKGRKAAPAGLKTKKPVSKPKEHEESPPLTPLESPLESPDILMKDDEEYRGPKLGRNVKNKKGREDEVSDAGSEGAIGTRRSTRATREYEAGL